MQKEPHAKDAKDRSKGMNLAFLECFTRVCGSCGPAKVISFAPFADLA